MHSDRRPSISKGHRRSQSLGQEEEAGRHWAASCSGQNNSFYHEETPKHRIDKRERKTSDGTKKWQLLVSHICSRWKIRHHSCWISNLFTSASPDLGEDNRHFTKASESRDFNAYSQDLCRRYSLYLPLNDIAVLLSLSAANNSLLASSRAAENQHFWKRTQYRFGIYMFGNSGESAADTVYVI